MRQDGHKFRLVATDMDGTLLGPDGAVSERTEKALHQARAQGLIVVLVTGRPPRWVRGVLDDGVVHELVICSNGAIVYDPAADTIVRSRPISSETLGRVVGAVRAVAPDVVMAVDRGRELVREAAYAYPAGTVVGSLEELAAKPASKLVLRSGGHTLDELAALVTGLVGDDVQVTYSGDQLVEVSAAGVTKGATLRELCADLGVDAGEVIAFGDMPNDVPMLTWAGYGVAVSNGHAAVLEIADEVAPPNGDDGVAQVLERILATGASAPVVG